MIQKPLIIGTERANMIYADLQKGIFRISSGSLFEKPCAATTYAAEGFLFWGRFGAEITLGTTWGQGINRDADHQSTTLYPSRISLFKSPRTNKLLHLYQVSRGGYLDADYRYFDQGEERGGVRTRVGE